MMAMGLVLLTAGLLAVGYGLLRRRAQAPVRAVAALVTGMGVVAMAGGGLLVWGRFLLDLGGGD